MTPRAALVTLTLALLALVGAWQGLVAVRPVLDTTAVAPGCVVRVDGVAESAGELRLHRGIHTITVSERTTGASVSEQTLFLELGSTVPLAAEPRCADRPAGAAGPSVRVEMTGKGLRGWLTTVVLLDAEDLLAPDRVAAAQAADAATWDVPVWDGGLTHWTLPSVEVRNRTFAIGGPGDHAIVTQVGECVGLPVGDLDCGRTETCPPGCRSQVDRFRAEGQASILLEIDAPAPREAPRGTRPGHLLTWNEVPDRAAAVGGCSASLAATLLANAGGDPAQFCDCGRAVAACGGDRSVGSLWAEPFTWNGSPARALVRQANWGGGAIFSRYPDGAYAAPASWGTCEAPRRDASEPAVPFGVVCAR